jgi:hypothetical protein
MITLFENLDDFEAATLTGKKEDSSMLKVKTFTIPLKIFQVRGRLQELDEEVIAFLEREGAQSIASVSDTHTTDDSGATIGLIRVVAYSCP